jgi:phosphohistidine phosphatase SixA
MELHLVRHACAGRKDEWDGPDAERPLDRVGELQAAALDDLFSPCRITRVLSSPARRCVDTVRPLASRHGLAVGTSTELRADVDAAELLRFLSTVEQGTVLCTHGEAMAGLLPDLRRAGCLAGPDLDVDRLLAKGVVWTLTVDPDREPPIVGLRDQLPWG